jgi:hydroxymethylbilane synthase
LKTIKIVSRKSNLARIQAYIVSDRLKEKYPEINIQYIFKSTLGDNDLTTPLNKMPDIGVFTSDIKEDLISGRADLAVHSWKDLPIETEAGTVISGTLKRADMRDMLFLKKESESNNGLKILSSSPRREKNLTSFLPKALPGNPTDIKFCDVRGNIQTRINKLIEGKEDGLIVAKAAIDRILESHAPEFEEGKKELKISLESLKWMVLPLSANPCAAAQGALALEVRSDDKELQSIIKSISDDASLDLIEEERSILKSYGGGCHQKIGASVESIEIGKIKTVKGESEEGKEIDERVFLAKEDLGDFFQGLSRSSFFPQNIKNQVFFKREQINEANETLNALRGKGIYISRSNALDPSVTINDSNCVWASGVSTWESLARQGVWVNGCSDSLGENNSPEENPFGEMKWLKLSHCDNKDEGKEILPTYRLIPVELSLDITKYTHFYWMSSTAFLRAISVYPEILKARHATGLGKTHDLISSMASNKVMAFLDYQDWISAVELNS